MFYNMRNTYVVTTMFRELVHQILKKIKNESYFKCPNNMGETPQGVTKAFIANTIKRGGTLQKIARRCGVIWGNWLRLGS